MDNGRSTITLLVMILLVLTWSACFIMHELTRLANAAEAILSTQTRF